ncbi:MAG: hypothetical protein R2830_21750 [Saprospiraceae bacterium]
MNIRNMKLSLTVDLLNLPSSQSPLFSIRRAMNKFEGETGGFKGLFRKSKSAVAEGFESQTIAFRFEKCTLDLELITDKLSHQQIVQGFNFTEHQS